MPAPGMSSRWDESQDAPKNVARPVGSTVWRGIDAREARDKKAGYSMQRNTHQRHVLRTPRQPRAAAAAQHPGRLSMPLRKKKGHPSEDGHVQSSSNSRRLLRLAHTRHVPESRPCLRVYRERTRAPRFEIYKHTAVLQRPGAEQCAKQIGGLHCNRLVDDQRLLAQRILHRTRRRRVLCIALRINQLRKQVADVR